jgi:LTXXQ motif family protein
VKKTLLAAALVAGVVIAAPPVDGIAQDANAQAAPAAPPPGDPGQAMPPKGGGPMMMRQMMMRRMMMARGNPQERCIDRLAWRAARRAYVETKLDLTAAQRPLWDKVQSAAQTEEQKERQFCTALPTSPSPATIIERLDRLQQLLSARLDGLRASQPAVAALYQALTPAQRAILDHPFRRS